MADCEHDQPLTPEMEATVARVAMQQGDLTHAAHHVAGAIASDPTRDDLVALLAELRDLADKPLDLFPLEGGTWFGAAACHAWLLHDEGRTGPALDLIGQVVVAKPDAPYLTWAADWVADGCPLPVAQHLLSSLLRSHEASLWRSGLPLLTALRALHPDDDTVQTLTAIGVRRSGQLDTALEWAVEGYERAPTYMGAVALANVHRERSDKASAIEAWKLALTHKPDDAGVRLDWADLELDQGDRREALRLYKEVTRREPQHAWAHPSVLYIGWMDKPSVDSRMKLRAWANTHQDSPRGAELAARATPFEGWLPSPSEACIDGIRQAKAQGLTMTSMALTSLEAASAMHCLGAIDASVGEIASPDLREPRGEPRWVLWQWEGYRPRPGLSHPSDDVRAAVGSIASYRFDRAGWLRMGAGLLDAFGAEALLASALHPPDPPDWAEPWDWMARCQVAVALAIAGHPAPYEGEKRAAMDSLLAVRNDWLTVAGVVGMMGLAHADPSSGPAVAQALTPLFGERPAFGGWTPEWALFCAALELGLGDAGDIALEVLRDIEESTG